MNNEHEHIPVSLLLTTRNEAEHISLFLDGVRAQSVRPAEIVVCDGGSTDGTGKLLQHEAALRQEESDAPPLRVIVAPGTNIAEGRNHAIRAAAQDILAFTDAGCELAPDWLERITEPLLRSDDVDAVGGGYDLVGDRAAQRWARAATLPFARQNAEQFLPSSRSFAARRIALEKAGLYPEHLTFAGEDTALVLRMKEQGARFVTRWDARVRWYPRPTLRAFLRQHYLYGLGDGEAGSNQARHLRTAVKWSAFLFLTVLAIAASLLHHYLWLALPPALLIVYGIRLGRIYAWNTYRWRDRLGGFLCIALKEWSMFAGYVVGRLRGAPGRNA
ncbi:MAG: glycosyltransferase [Bacteroidetes bacterium]|nr:glycosyltransferase [Bacteroidota bacterium]